MLALRLKMVNQTIESNSVCTQRTAGVLAQILASTLASELVPPPHSR